MKVFVLATDYPDNNGHVTLMYIHSRNVYYKAHGIDVTVLNFSAKEQYDIDGIKVLSLSDYMKSSENYQVLVCHAANLRNHYRFLKKYGDRFPKFIFFFHGHEVLKVRETYSTPYPYMKTRGITNSFIQDLYDEYKLSVWRHYYPKVKDKSILIFVSGWMKNKFEHYVKLDTEMFNHYIIPNNVGKIFEEQSYNPNNPKKFDFITIRSNLDGSKYCVDIVNKLAKENPDYTFCVVGKGAFFEHNEKANNITWVNRGLSHEEIPEFLNSARCALMPTRLDAQGVMMCEMATFGIPVLTSDIDICQEVSGIFKNMMMFNISDSIDLSDYLTRASEMQYLPKNHSFFSLETVGKEVELIKDIIGQ